MNVYFSQIYIEPDAWFPFSHHFQRRLSDLTTGMVAPSTTYVRTYGDDWDLIFNVSAKSKIPENEIRGPSVFARDRNVEYTIFLPFNVIRDSAHVQKQALQFLLNGCCHVLRELDIDTTSIEGSTHSIIEAICSDPKMFK